MDKDLTVYEPPMLVEVGGFKQLTHGTNCECQDSVNVRYSKAGEVEWLWGPVAF
jgi:hypothetical protein